MPSFRTQKLEELGSHGKRLWFGVRALEERFHGICGYLVVDGGVQPPAVVVGLDELDDGMLGGVAGREAPAVAVAGAAAGKAHVVGLRPLSQCPTGVLGAPVAVEYGVSRHLAARLGRLERRHRDVGGLVSELVGELCGWVGHI